MSAAEHFFAVEPLADSAILRLLSDDGTNRLTRARLAALTVAIENLRHGHPAKLIITGNSHFFSAGADLQEIAELYGAEAFCFAHMGQRLMNAVANFSCPDGRRRSWLLDGRRA